MRWDAWARGRGHARPYVRRWPRRGPTIPPPKESLKRGGERPYGPSRARNFPQCRSSGGPGAAVCIEAAAPAGQRWTWCPIRTQPKQQEFFLTARRGRGCAGTFRTGGRGYSESGGVYSGADRRGQRPQDGHRTAQEGREAMRRPPARVPLPLPATRGPGTATGGPGRTLPPSRPGRCPPMGSGGGAHAGRLHAQGGGPEDGGTPGPAPRRGGVLPASAPPGRPRRAGGAVRRPLPCPCPCPPRRAQRRPQEAQGVPSHHPGQGGALPWGAAAVPTLGGSMPRAAAPRMAAHQAQLHAGARLTPSPHPKKV